MIDKNCYSAIHRNPMEVNEERVLKHRFYLFMGHVTRQKYTNE